MLGYMIWLNKYTIYHEYEIKIFKIDLAIFQHDYFSSTEQKTAKRFG